MCTVCGRYSSREEVVIAALSVSPPATEVDHDHNRSVDSEDSATKIGAMFPTVSEERIKELLKRCWPPPADRLHAPPPPRVPYTAHRTSPVPPLPAYSWRPHPRHI